MLLPPGRGTGRAGDLDSDRRREVIRPFDFTPGWLPYRAAVRLRGSGTGRQGHLREMRAAVPLAPPQSTTGTARRPLPDRMT
jgi:hypothetical protein